MYKKITKLKPSQQGLIMNYKMILSIALLTTTSALVFAGESQKLGNPVQRSPNSLDMTQFVPKQPKNPSNGLPLKPSERLNNAKNSETKK